MDVNNKKSFIVDRLTKWEKIDNPEIIFVTPQNDNQSNLIFEGNHEQNLSVNNISLNNLEKKLNIANPDFVCNKLFRFIFPKSDPEQDPSWHIDKRSQPQRFLSIICNSLSILNELELNHWNQL